MRRLRPGGVLYLPLVTFATEATTSLAALEASSRAAALRFGARLALTASANELAFASITPQIWERSSLVTYCPPAILLQR